MILVVGAVIGILVLSFMWVSQSSKQRRSMVRSKRESSWREWIADGSEKDE